MSPPSNPHRALRSLTEIFHPYRAVVRTQPSHTKTQARWLSLRETYKPSEDFRASQAIKQNRINDKLRPIKVYRPPRSTVKQCPDPIKVITQSQIATLDPTGARTRLFDVKNPDKANVGDILLVRLKNGEPFSGVCIEIRQRHQPIDTAILLRNQLTRVGVEMWFKVYSPNVQGIEVVQRKPGRRARRAKLYYMRNAKHDRGSVEGIVAAYLRTRVGGPLAGGGQTRGRNPGKKAARTTKKA